MSIPGAGGLDGPVAACPVLDPAAPLQFIINGAAGSSDAGVQRATIEAALLAGGRRGELHVCGPGELARVAQAGAARALAAHAAVVAVGGDGTLNTVAQAAHAVGCPMGVVPRGTFNYFARTHGIPADPAEAVRHLLSCAPCPVQVAGINDRVFLVDASLGLYPELLEDREAYKARFGRSRWVALWAAAVTLLRAQRRLRLHIEQGGRVRDVRALTLFVGNNRLQLEQFGVPPAGPADGGAGNGLITAVMLRPVGTLAMLGLMLRGAMGTLGEAQDVDHFSFDTMTVVPTRRRRRRGVKVAFDGEVTTMRAPLHFRVLARPLYLLRRPRDDAAVDAGSQPGATGG